MGVNNLADLCRIVDILLDSAAAGARTRDCSQSDALATRVTVKL